MSIQNNSAGLQRILEAVNNLPEGGSGGGSVQRAEGTYTTDSDGFASVTCGFQPDVIYLKGSTYTDSEGSYQLSASVAFSLETRSGWPNVYFVQLDSGGDISKIFDMSFERNTSGFTTYASYYTTSWSYRTGSNQTFNYTAVKYT